MYEDYTNIYQAARAAAGLTQERAAELLGLSVESVKAYEHDTTIPKEPTVLKMVDIYGAPFLAVQHMRSTTAIARSVIPEFCVTSLPQAVVQLLCRIRDFSERHRTDELMRIAEDGAIDSVERPIYEDILDELDDIIKAAMALRYVKEMS
ncbi:MAG: helix-turn-helix transcriptional regulator [Oscillospiraceae bacterium]